MNDESSLSNAEEFNHWAPGTVLLPDYRGNGLVSCLTIAATGSSLQTQSPESQEALAIGGQTLWVGMSRDNALSRLQLCCELSGSGDSFFVQSRSGPPFSLLGAIWFRDGRVAGLRRDGMYSDDPEVASVTLALFRLLSEYQAQGRSVVSLETVTDELRNGTTRTIVLRFVGRRTVTISVLNPDTAKQGPSVQIAEEVGAR